MSVYRAFSVTVYTRNYEKELGVITFAASCWQIAEEAAAKMAYQFARDRGLTSEDYDYGLEER